MKKILSILTKFYSWLLNFYPRTFRKEFGGEMLLDFAETADAVSKRGIVSLFVVLLRELRDFPINLLHTHLIKEHMINIFQPESVRRILRTALAFGLAFAIVRITVSIVFDVITNQGWLFLLGIANSHGWILNYDAVTQTILYFFSLVVGALLSGLLLSLVLRETCQIKRYLLASVLAWVLPFALHQIAWEFLKNTDSTFINGILSLSYVILMGLGMGVLFSLIIQDRKKMPRLMFVGGLGYFLANWAYAFLIWRFDPFNSYDPFLWKRFLFMTTGYIMMGAIVGALLGAVSVWSRQKVTLA